MDALERMDALKRIASGVVALFLLKSRYCKPCGGRPQAFPLPALLFPATSPTRSRSFLIFLSDISMDKTSQALYGEAVSERVA